MAKQFKSQQFIVSPLSSLVCSCENNREHFTVPLVLVGLPTVMSNSVSSQLILFSLKYYSIFYILFSLNCPSSVLTCVNLEFTVIRHIYLFSEDVRILNTVSTYLLVS